MQNPDKLEISALARSLAATVYRSTSSFPDSERFGLTAQMRRAAVSVGSDIAEGCGRDGPRDFARFLHMALGSANELAFQAVVSIDLNFLEEDSAAVLLDKIEHIRRALIRFIKVVRSREG